MACFQHREKLVVALQFFSRTLHSNAAARWAFDPVAEREEWARTHELPTFLAPSAWHRACITAGQRIRIAIITGGRQHGTWKMDIGHRILFSGSGLRRKFIAHK